MQIAIMQQLVMEWTIRGLVMDEILIENTREDYFS